jgi:hypothetical protein
MFGKCGMTPASTIDLHPLYLVAVSNITCCFQK